MKTVNTDVVIAGAGPVGLLLAAELRLQGSEVIVLEQLDAPSPHARAFGLHARSIESLRLRGLVERLAKGTEQPVAMFGNHRPPGGGGPVPLVHFAGIRTVRLDRLDSASPGILPIAQTGTEAVLAERAAELGASVRRGHRVAAVDQDPDGVTVTAESAAGRVAFRAAYLVGCDGGRSTVRKLAGFAFPGDDPTITGRLAEVAVPELLANPGGGWHRLAGGVLQVLPGRILAVEFDGPPADREQPVTKQEFADSLERITGRRIELTAEPTWLSRFTDNTRLAEHYRLGRVLLAGDAAHVHSPFGGQGLNLGLQDAMNLGWKLAAAVAGTAPEGLLDSYQRERRPVAARVLHNTRAQVALMNPDPGVTPLRELFTELMELDEVNLALAELLSAVAVTYHQAHDAHPLTGAFVPDLALTTADGTACSPLDLLADGRPVLLDLTSDARLHAAARDRADRVRLVKATVKATFKAPVKAPIKAPVAAPVRGGGAPAGLLIRPDGYLAWAGGAAGAATDADPAAEVDLAGLRAALATWVGQPKVAVAAAN
ncbi:FAD-dependent monooxygenase [Kitasatospora sp. NBC_01287]|uniref:FAD-dependent monooxygenase n=1 Tax=Kitasatospora sp. NBC_01287 TaxID=2903573 RepID=UPI00224CBD59|nr:FAD-dependent monooxygenase [Kitasatospora sp. NBC_01287]MCX4746173.1 FAD-dependent monooxygenase [Kitasatospora sp. NBC_01287]